MISRLLEEAGLFLGKEKDHNNEALFFFHINNWLLRQAVGSWDQPEAIRYFLAHRDVRPLAVKYIRFIMKTPEVTKFLGWEQYLKYRSPEKLNIPWGWKDPRSTFTLPLWLDIFPDAKIIHIYRNGVDVANSLKVRENRPLSGLSLAINDKRRFLYLLRPKRGGFINRSMRCASLEGCFSLWEEYLNEAKSHVSRMQDRAMEVKYEDFLENPGEVMISLLNFCGLSADDAVMTKLLQQLKKSRAYAYKDKPELQAFSEEVAMRLSRYGY